MKKFFTLFLLSITVFVLNAQQNDLAYLKEVLAKHGLSSNDAARGNTYLLLQSTTQFFDEKSGKGDSPSKAVYSYDKKGFTTLVITSVYDSLSKKWVESSKEEYLNDAKGQILNINGYQFFQGKWVKSTLSTNTYDSNGLRKSVTVLGYKYDTSTPDSTNFEIYVDFSYDAKKNRTKDVGKFIYKFSATPDINYNVYEYVYNAANKVSIEKFFYGKDPKSLSWSSERVYTYNSDNNLVKNESFEVVNDVKTGKISNRTTNTYSAKKLVSETLYESVNFTTKLLEEDTKDVFLYDNNDNNVNRKNYQKSNTTGKLYYRSNIDYIYSLFVGAKDVATIDFKLSPNPATTVLNISTSDATVAYAIFNTDGRLVNAGNGDFQTIDVSQLEKGMYILKIQTNKGMGISKFVKE